VSAQPSPQQVHIDAYGERKEKRKVATLTAASRKALPDSAFALPGRRYPIHDEAHARNAMSRVMQHGNPEEQGKVRAAVRRRYPNIGKDEFYLTADVWKDDARHIVYGVVLEPDLVDSQGDTVNAAEVEKAAHRYLSESRMTDTRHDEQKAAVDVIESYVAPHDMVVAGSPVRKGAWVMGCKVKDMDLWDQIVKKELTGYSIGGRGIRLEDPDPEYEP